MKYGLIEALNDIQFFVSPTGNFVGLSAPNSIASSFTLNLPGALPGSTQVLTVDASGNFGYANIGNSGTVTSVALTADPIFNNPGSAITTSGTFTVTLKSQAAGLVLASPTGASGTPTFRAIAYSDVSALVGTGSNTIASGNDTRFHLQNTDTGTTQTSFAIDSTGTGVRLKNSSGALRLRNLADSADADLIVSNLTVTGTTTTVNSETVTIDDNIIVLNNNVSTGTPTEDGGVQVRRGGSPPASFIFDETNDWWKAGLVGSELAIVRRYTTSFTNASLSSGVLTITHNLGFQFPAVRIIDNTNKLIGLPDGVTYTDANSLTIDLTSFGTLTGTWNAVVQ